jgi:hypothetical protein
VKESIAPDGYFEFTRPQDSIKKLKKWIEWFDKKNIKTVVVETEINGHLRYVLCREGVEA